jgi:lysozyme
MLKTKLLMLFLSLLDESPLPRQINLEGRQLLAQSESLRLDAYPDGSVWTIGWGTTRIGGKPVVKGMRLTRRDADLLFHKDLLRFEQEIESLVTVPLTDNQYAALVSLVYNIGGAKFKSSTLLKLLNQSKYEEAAEEFPRWVFSRGKRLAGLVKRRDAEKNLFLQKDKK